MPGHAIIAVNGAEEIKDMWLDGKDGGVWILDVSKIGRNEHIPNTNYQLAMSLWTHRIHGTGITYCITYNSA